MSLDMEQYRQVFLEEAREHMATVTQALLILEKDVKNADALNKIFRSAHTLKSSSAMMGFQDFSDLAHAMEDIFDGLRKGGRVSGDLADVLLECVDALNERLDNIQNGVEQEIETAQFVQKLFEVSKTGQPTSATIPTNDVRAIPDEDGGLTFSENERREIEKTLTDGNKCFLVDAQFQSDCTFKSVRAGMVLEKLAEKGIIVKTVPRKDEISEGTLKLGLKIVLASKFAEEELRQAANSVCEIEQIQVTSINANSFGQPKKDKPRSQSTKETDYALDTKTAQTVRVHFTQLDKLMNLAGELVINKIGLVQHVPEIGNDILDRVTANIDRLTTDLQDLVMQIRMVPVSQVFDRFPRLVRDLSKEKGKSIDLVMEGREIEVDRTVLDEIGEPLIHLLRNCVDHGIESSEERSKLGKNPTGTLKLVAQRKGDHIVIEVEDDGAGISAERIRESCVEKGLIQEFKAKEMTEEQLINLIFLPGLSTAKEITETSGRGVGMDVVKTKIEALGGTVQVETHAQKGTKFTLRLPSTLAIIKALLVKETDQIFAIPTGQVSEVVSITRKEVKSLGSLDAIQVRGKIVPLFYLRELLRLQGDIDSEKLEILIVSGSAEKQKIGLAVSAVVGLQEILIKPLDETLKNIKGFGGVTILGNGSVVLVLDLATLLSRSNEEEVSLEVMEVST